MAAIDKIYGTPEQWDAMRDWLSTKREEFVQHMYPRPKEDRGPLSNFPLEVDAWLWTQKDLPEFIRDGLRNQYIDPQNRFALRT